MNGTENQFAHVDAVIRLCERNEARHEALQKDKKEREFAHNLASVMDETPPPLNDTCTHVLPVGGCLSCEGVTKHPARDTTDTTVNRGGDDRIGFLGLMSIVFCFGGATAFWMSIHYGTTAKALPLVFAYGILGGVFWIGDQSGKEARNGDK